MFYHISPDAGNPMLLHRLPLLSRYLRREAVYVACVTFSVFTPPPVCSLTTHLLPEPFQPTLGVLPLLLALPTAVVQCCAATIRQRPLWMLPLSLALALCKAAAGTVIMPATLILGNSEVRLYACVHETVAAVANEWMFSGVTRAGQTGPRAWEPQPPLLP